MSEKRFICGLGFPINSDDPIRIISDKVGDKDYYKFSDICNILNEQQATICKLQDLCGESDGENAKLRIKNKEQQTTIHKLTDEKEYWKNKAMTLLFQVRRLTPRMTDAEVKEFSKELENE